jgi:hypothetical protein
MATTVSTPRCSNTNAGDPIAAIAVVRRVGATTPRA